MSTVLIIEDEALIAYDLAYIAQQAGMQTALVALTGEDAISKAKQQRPHVIISDHMLEYGTGPEAVAEIYQMHGQIPTIYISATPELCEPYENVAIFSKPIDEKALEACIQSIKISA